MTFPYTYAFTQITHTERQRTARVTVALALLPTCWKPVPRPGLPQLPLVAIGGCSMRTHVYACMRLRMCKLTARQAAAVAAAVAVLGWHVVSQ